MMFTKTFWKAVAGIVGLIFIPLGAGILGANWARVVGYEVLLAGILIVVIAVVSFLLPSGEGWNP